MRPDPGPRSASNAGAALDDGAALPTVLFIAVVASALVGSLALTHLAERRLVAQDARATQALYAAEGGLHHALGALAQGTRLGEVSEAPPDTTIRLDAQPYGAYVRIASQARRGPATARVVATVGQSPPEAFGAALVYGSPEVLTFAGDVVIVGDVETGEAGTSTGALRGQPYQGAVDGDLTRRVSSPLPGFDDAMLRETLARHASYLALLSSRAVSDETPPLVWTDPPPQILEAEAPFVDSLRVYVAGPVLSGETRVVGPALILAAGDLEVAAALPPDTQIAAAGTVALTDQAEATGVLVTADQIRVASATGVQGQFLARRALSASGGARLAHPSVLYVEGRTATSDADRLEVTDAVVEGLVLTPPGDTPLLAAEPARLVVGPDATVRGAVYAGRRATVTGRIEGTLLAQGFTFFASPATYVNWLADATIDRTALPGDLVVPFGLGSSPAFRVLRQDVTVSYRS